MTKKEVKKYAQSTIAHYLDEIQAITGNYLDTLELLERQPKEILFMRNDELKYYLSTIKMCMYAVPHSGVEIKYSKSGFKVKLLTTKI
jgi:hypothetical protein